MDRNSFLCITKLVNEILMKDEITLESPQIFFSFSNTARI